MVNRDRTETVRDILRNANKWTSKSSIWYRTYMNYKQFQKYHAALVESGLLEERKIESKKPNDDRNRHQYKTSEEGSKLLYYLNESSLLMERFRKSMAKEV